jgi:hypothetical protein
MLEIRYQPTPNPNAGKFVIGAAHVALPSARSFGSPAQAADHPLAAALFSVAGVSSVFMVSDFVTVTKLPDASWAELVPRLEAAIRTVLTG